MYDPNEIKSRVSKNKQSFLTAFIATVTVMIAALILIILALDTVVTFISIIVDLAALLALYVIFNKYEPRILFSPEIKGVSIKEHEYTVRASSKGPGMRWYAQGGRAAPQPFAPNTRANMKPSNPNLRASVYLETDSGNLTELRGLLKPHIELFREGDTLLKYAGTRYPVLISRQSEVQPCPICGEMNDMSSTACHACGLTITGEDKES